MWSLNAAPGFTEGSGLGMENSDETLFIYVPSCVYVIVSVVSSSRDSHRAVEVQVLVQRHQVEECKRVSLSGETRQRVKSADDCSVAVLSRAVHRCNDSKLKAPRHKFAMFSNNNDALEQSCVPLFCSSTPHN